MCQALWGNTDLSWESQPTINTAGGLLCIWNDQVYKVERRVTGRGFIFLEGVWTQAMQKLYIVNVYAPCDASSKRAFWEDVKLLKNSDPSGLWCILGDFNSIRDPVERLSVS